MTLIDKYVYTVTKNLPKKTRADVEKELRGSIMDMLPDDFTEIDVEKALYMLGNPAVMAEEYRDGRGVLIGPGLYNQYIYVLKLVFVIMACIIPIAAIASAVLEHDNNVVLHALRMFWSFGINTTAHSIGWVTAVFAIMERTRAFEKEKWPYTGKKWSVSDLLEPTVSQINTISKVEASFSLALVIAVATAICFFPKYLGWYTHEGGGWSVIPLFNSDVLSLYIPFILLSAVIAIITTTLMLAYKRWNMKLFIANTVNSFFVVALTGAMVFNRRLISEGFHDAFVEGVSGAEHSPEALGLAIAIIIMASVFMSCFWDVVSSFRKIKAERQMEV